MVEYLIAKFIIIFPKAFCSEIWGLGSSIFTTQVELNSWSSGKAVYIDETGHSIKT